MDRKDSHFVCLNELHLTVMAVDQYTVKKCLTYNSLLKSVYIYWKEYKVYWFQVDTKTGLCVIIEHICTLDNNLAN